MREQILRDTAFLEAALDDPEHISLDGFAETLKENVEKEIAVISEMIQSYENSRMLREGVRTVILGKPNAGKSSLLNTMLKEERAIVTEIAGTTRDTLEETVFLNGVALNIVDTAGIRWTKDAVERIGVDKARAAAKDADLILYVVDSSVPLDENDMEIITLIASKPAFVLLNKSDLQQVVSEEELRKHTLKEIVRISVKEKEGLDLLEQKITDLFFSGVLSYNDEIYLTNERHKAALHTAVQSLSQVLESINQGMPEDFYSIDLTDAYEELGRIIGQSVDEDVINKIFQDFCMGK